MAKQIAALVLTAALALGAGTAAAHAVVIGSSLQTQPVRAGTATQVVVQFNSSIEVGLCRTSTLRTGAGRAGLIVMQW